jgi:hypothetical protein
VLPLLPPLFNSTNDCVLIANYSLQNTCSRELCSLSSLDGLSLRAQETTALRWLVQAAFSHTSERTTHRLRASAPCNHSSSNRSSCAVAAHSQG